VILEWYGNWKSVVDIPVYIIEILHEFIIIYDFMVISGSRGC
jgi:hypothetical protein